MNDGDEKRCKKCGAVLVGKKANKKMLCSSCNRNVGNGGAKVFGVFAVVGVVAKVAKNFIKR